MTLLAPVAYVVAFIALLAKSAPDPTVPQADDGASHSLSLDAHPSSTSKCTVDRQNNLTTHGTSHYPSSTSKCIFDHQNNLTTLFFRFKESTNSSSTISAIYTQDTWTVNEPGGIPDAYSTLKVYVGSVEFFSQHLSLENGRIQKTVQWGPMIQGANAAFINAASSAVTNGTIDGRSFVLRDSKTIAFLDGKDPPILTIPTELQHIMSSFAPRMATTLKLCITDSTGYNISMPASVSPIFVRQEGGEDRGHFSSTYSDVTCIACKALWTFW
jgi:hypothetical protein